MTTNLAVLAPQAVLHHAASCEHVRPKPFREFVRSSSNSGCTRRASARLGVRYGHGLIGQHRCDRQDDDRCPALERWRPVSGPGPWTRER